MALKFKKNDLINDDYKILGIVGEGGMSVVYRAQDLKNKRDVALKFLKEGVTSSYVEDVIRFKREADAVSKLDHPHVIKLYEAGEYKNTPYLAEELLEGKSLSALLNEGKHFTVKETVHIILKVTEALDYVHKRGIIHRDLKPGNIVVQQKPNDYRVTLLDFGIAHVMELSHIKEAKQIVGTFGYMSPEATGIVSKQIDERSDFYSLGVVFYQLLSRELPFKATEVNKLLHEQVAVKPRRLREVNKEIPKILEEIVIKLLNKDPELRYQSAKGLLHDLERYQKGEMDFIVAEKDQKTKLTYQTRLVGRQEELKQIREAYERAKDSEGNICLIGGEPGIGKSRLVEEMKEYLYEQGYEGGGLFIHGRCLNQENKIPYQPFRDSINEYIQKIEKMNLKEREKEIRRLKEVLGELGEIIIRLNPRMKLILGEVPELVSLDPERENQRFMMVASDFFCHLTEKNRISVLFIDDLQWADEGSLSLLEEISWKIGNFNFFIIGAYRDDEITDKHSLNRIKKQIQKGKGPLLDIRLAKFDRNSLNKMVAGVLGEKEERSVKLSEYVLEKSAGNPFFAITILRELVEEKALTWKEGYWQEDWDRIDAIKISNNIIDLVIKRIDDLTEEQNRFLQVCSIIGREIDLKLLNRLLGLEESALVKLIDDLILIQLIERSRQKGKVNFIHGRIREAFLEQSNKADNKKIHLAIAQAIEQENKDSIDNVIFELAYHYTEGGDEKKSLEYVLPAADKAKINFANEDAIRYYQLGIKLLEKKGLQKSDKWIEIKEDLVEVYITSGRSDEAINLAKEILPLKKEKLDKEKIYRKMGSAYFKKGDWTFCEKNLIKGINQLNEKVPSNMFETVFYVLRELIIHILHSLFPKLFILKDPKKASKVDEERIWLYRSFGWLYVLSDIVKFIYITFRMLNVTESRLGKSWLLGNAYGIFGSLYMAIPMFKYAIKYHEKGLKLNNELKYDWGIAQDLQLMGFCYSWKGDYKRSIEIFE
ncbi:MAG: protein kinase, partial [Spirochaetes bacterium]|nr:protein kinase [Spirochaetota bacterium]